MRNNIRLLISGMLFQTE